MEFRISFIIATLLGSMVHAQSPVNRKQLVQRHNVKVNRIDSLASLSVGNGKFAFTADATGFQSFPETYSNGIVLGTQSEWGWNSFENKANYKIEESYKNYLQYGDTVS